MPTSSKSYRNGYDKLTYGSTCAVVVFYSTSGCVVCKQ